MVSASLLSSVPRSSISGRIQNLSVARKIGLVFLGLLLSTALIAVLLLWQLQRVNQQVAQATAHSEQRMLWAVRWQALTNQALAVAPAGASSEEALIASAKARSFWMRWSRWGNCAQASTAQRDGIGHIHSAVLKLDDMTRQNADLVQSCGQATDTMQREVAQLAQEVGVFQLAQLEGAAGTPVRRAQATPLLAAA